MTWTYDGDPTGDRRDEVRMMVGDTDALDPLLQDAEIEYILSQYVPVEGKAAWRAAAGACDAIAGRFGRKAQRSVGPLSVSAQQQFEHYRLMADHWRLMAATNGKGNAGGFGAIPAAGPILSGGGPTYLGGPNTAYSPQSDR